MWNNQYSDVRLDITNGPVSINNLDFEIALDVVPEKKRIETSIIGVGQMGQVPNVEMFASKEPPPMAMKTENAGKTNTVPLELGTDGVIKVTAVISTIYRVRCPKLLDKTTLHLVIAGLTFDPKRVPRKIDVWGSYEVSSATSTERKNFDYSYPITKPL